jgi:hypothetical protein
MVDCTEALWKMKLVLHTVGHHTVDLDPYVTSHVNIDDNRHYGHIERGLEAIDMPLGQPMPDFDRESFMSQLLPISVPVSRFGYMDDQSGISSIQSAGSSKRTRKNF